MVDVLLYSIIEFASGFAPSLTIFLFYAPSLGSQWAGNGVSERRLQWNLFRRTLEVLYPGCYNRVIRRDISSLRSCMAYYSNISVGAGCL